MLSSLGSSGSSAGGGRGGSVAAEAAGRTHAPTRPRREARLGSARWSRSPRGGAGVRAAAPGSLRAAASGAGWRCAISPFLPSRLSSQCRGRRPYVAPEPVRAAGASDPCLLRSRIDVRRTWTGTAQSETSVPLPAKVDPQSRRFGRHVFTPPWATSRGKRLPSAWPSGARRLEFGT
jgi:hypothetical protein